MNLNEGIAKFCLDTELLHAQPSHQGHCPTEPEACAAITTGTVQL